MNASNLFAAVATVAISAISASAFASTVPAGAAATAAAAAHVSSVAAKSLNVPNVLVQRGAGPSRAAVRAEAVQAVANYRATSVAQFDWLSK